MAGINSARLEKITSNVSAWYVDKRQMLIKSLEADGFPYGSVELSPAEQLIRFKSMTAEDWQALTEKLYDRFRGLPNASAKVSEELAEYKGKMEALEQQRPDFRMMR